MGDGIRPDFTPPRILFAIAGDGAGNYRLDFQDINLIRTRAEGGVFGDPYEPLTAEGTSFTTHAYGRSAWRWSEADTYTCQEGTWYKTMSESTYGYGPLITSYQKDDWRVESVVCSENVILSEERMKRPEEAYRSDYCDEDCVLYTFRDEDSLLYYLAMYRFQDRRLAVLAEQEQEILESRVPYLSLIYEISGDEIIAEVYVGSEPPPVWRMRSNGSSLKQIGQIPAKS